MRVAILAALLAPALACGEPGGGGPPPGPGTPGTPGPAAPAVGSPTFAGCPVLPPDDPWNEDVSALPVDPASDALIAAMAPDEAIKLALGVTEQHYGQPVAVVPPGQPLVPIEYGVEGEDYRSESDPGPFPIPLDVPIQGGSAESPDPVSGARHVVVVQRETCLLFELYKAVRIPGGFRVASSVRWDLRRTPSRPPGWTSADAAGLPIFPGLLRWDEVESGEIAHALRFTAPRVRRAYVAPANHCGPNADPSLPPYGTRVRLRADFDVTPYTGPARVLLEALKRHGMILADEGTPWTIGGSTHEGFGEVLRQLRARPVPGRAFEVVRLGTIVTEC